MEIMRINKGIKFAIKVMGLSLGRNYVANLCTEDVTKVYTAKTNFLEDGIITFTWDAEETERIPADQPITLEIFDENRDLMTRKERFAIAKNTSAITKD